MATQGLTERGAECRRRGIALLAVATIAFVGCSRASTPDASPASVATVSDVASTVVAGPGAPSVCSGLAASTALVELTKAIPLLVGGDQNGAEAVESAGSALQDLDSTASGSLAASMRRAEAAIDTATNGHVTDAELEELSASFADFGQEVQAQCDFPL